MTAAGRSLLALHAGVLLFGITALFSKLITLSAVEITFFRSIVAASALIVVMLFTRSSLRLPRGRDYLVATLLGVLLAGHWSTYFHAMQVSSVAVGVIALHTFPVMTVFLEPLFHGERPRPRDLASALAVLLGVYLLVPEFDLSAGATQGVLWGSLSALLYALRNVIQRRYLSAEPARRALLYQLVVVSLVLLPLSAAGAEQVSGTQWLLLVVLGLVFTALPHTLFIHGLRHFNAKTVSIVACLQVFYAMAFAALVLSEWPTLSTWAGGMIVVGVAMFESYTASGSRLAKPGARSTRA